MKLGLGWIFIASSSFAIECPELLESTSPDFINWSTPFPRGHTDLGPPRIGRENFDLELDASNEVTGIVFRLPGGQQHRVAVSRRDFVYPVDKVIREEMIVASGLEFLPTAFIPYLKRINFLHMGAKGIVSTHRPRLIHLNVDGFRPETLAHELGHVVHFQTKRWWFRWGRAMRKDGNSVSPYGDTNRLEDFAETLVAYLEPDPKLRADYRRKHPSRFKLLDEMQTGQYRAVFTSQRILIRDPYTGTILLISMGTIAGLLGTAIFSVVDSFVSGSSAN
jgi:hypothetical protein